MRPNTSEPERTSVTIVTTVHDGEPLAREPLGSRQAGIRKVRRPTPHTPTPADTGIPTGGLRVLHRRRLESSSDAEGTIRSSRYSRSGDLRPARALWPVAQIRFHARCFAPRDEHRIPRSRDCAPVSPASALRSCPRRPGASFSRRYSAVFAGSMLDARGSKEVAAFEPRRFAGYFASGGGFKVAASPSAFGRGQFRSTRCTRGQSRFDPESRCKSARVSYHSVL